MLLMLSQPKIQSPKISGRKVSSTHIATHIDRSNKMYKSCSLLDSCALVLEVGCQLAMLEEAGCSGTEVHPLWIVFN